MLGMDAAALRRHPHLLPRRSLPTPQHPDFFGAVFPNVPVPPGQTREAGYSECAMKGLAVKPRKGDAGEGGLVKGETA